MDYYTCRIYDFNVYNTPDTTIEPDEDNAFKDTDMFAIQMFGIDERGTTYSIVVEGFKPFFYVMVHEGWTPSDKDKFIDHLKTKLGKKYSSSICNSKLIRRRKLYGFDNRREHKFIFIQFSNTNVFKRAQNLWYSDYNSGHKLLKHGYQFMDTNMMLYEANIPPLLRFFHVHNISPSGWIKIAKKKSIEYKGDVMHVNCHVELKTNVSNIIPLNEKETRVPFKIMSFDIEASSSHGDFPVPIKSYKKLATNIMEHLENQPTQILTKPHIRTILHQCILSAFGYDSMDTIDLVYPKTKCTKEFVERQFNKWIECNLKIVNPSEDTSTAFSLETAFEAMFKANQQEDGDDDEIDVGEGGGEREGEGERQGEEYEVMRPKPRLKKHEGNTTITTIIDILLDNKCEREVKLHELNTSLSAMFPKLEGDKVTFIGSTFMNYGNKDPHLNHCIVLNTCAPIPMDNSVVETYSTEKEVLLAWQQLVQRENPDIIIGYNIFGFDYEFMFRRAEENNCVEDFLKLSRNIDEVCGTRDKDTHKWKIEESSIQVASGQYDLRFIKINGRLQVDLYNFYRKTANLTSYKLDSVAGNFIGDYIKKILPETETETGGSIIVTDNLTGLLIGSSIHIEEIGHSVEYYKQGAKFTVTSIDSAARSFTLDEFVSPDFSKKVRWCLAKDDVTPQDIFRMTKGTDQDRSVIAKYCIQDCNLVHYLFNKSDVLTGFIEMAKICSVPMNFLVMRGQGIKLQSLIANECRQVRTLMPVIEKGDLDDGYEGAIVLKAKCDLYLDNPVACNDYASLYPSSMISENLSHDSKVWTKEYDLGSNLIEEWGEKDADGNYLYDNLPEYEYVDVTYDTYKYTRKHPKAKAEKIKCGFKICRYAQFDSGIMPSILKKLLKARKTTRKLIPNEKDEFMKQVLEQRQNGYKVTANSLYGGCGAKTSSFYEKDIAACTTAIGRKLLTYGKRIVEQCYANKVCETTNHGSVLANAEYIYGDTDSVFYTFNLKTLDGVPIRGKQALEITIELAQEAGELAAKFLKQPHDFEYEKTFMPFCLLSKKRYVGMLYETDPNKCKRKEMGIVLKRRDNAPIVKDVYGGIIDILMKKQSIRESIAFLKGHLQQIVECNAPMDKFIITKSLRSGYKNPKSIAHKVLADRITERDPGNKPGAGDRIPFVFIVVPGNPKKTLQGNKIETPTYVVEHGLKIDYGFYITNQIMKPVQQLFALVLEKIWAENGTNGKKALNNIKLSNYKKSVKEIRDKYDWDEAKIEEKVEELRCKEIKELLFDPFIRKASHDKEGIRGIDTMFAKKNK